MRPYNMNAKESFSKFKPNATNNDSFMTNNLEVKNPKLRVSEVKRISNAPKPLKSAMAPNVNLKTPQRVKQQRENSEL